MGTCIGWSGPVIHILSNSSTTAFPVSTTQSNFIASLMPAGALFGGLTGGMVMNNIGRKGAMMGTSTFFALTYLCLAAAQNVLVLFPVGGGFRWLASLGVYFGPSCYVFVQKALLICWPKKILMALAKHCSFLEDTN